MHEKDEKIDTLKAEIKELNDKFDKFYLQVEKLKSDYNDQINKLNLKIEWKDNKLKQPRKTEDIPEWVEKQFAGKLIFHNRAIGEIKKTPTGEIDMSLLCDAIEYLANEYRDELLGLISEVESNNICSDKYNRSFVVAPTGDKSIEMYTKEYKVKYRKGQAGKPREVLLDQHLKVGKGNKDNLRIYFFYDEEKEFGRPVVFQRAASKDDPSGYIEQIIDPAYWVPENKRVTSDIKAYAPAWWMSLTPAAYPTSGIPKVPPPVAKK